jgi:hypothetical protein
MMLISYFNARNPIFSFGKFHRSHLSNAWSDASAALSPQAILFTISFVGAGAAISSATGLSFSRIPNFLPFLAVIIGFDVICRLAPRTRISASVSIALYSYIYLVLTCIAAAFVSYATQRFCFPLQDDLFSSIDYFLGVDRIGFVRWVDGHPQIAIILRGCYVSMDAQMILPVVVLALMDRVDDLRNYLLAFVLSLAVTMLVAAFLPAKSAYAFIDSSTFHNVQFIGHTPLSHLQQLRTEGPLTIDARSAGGLISLPSFHAVVATLTLSALRCQKAIFYPLAILTGGTLLSAVTEGGHYVIDVIVGAALAITAQLAARGMLRRPVA